MTMALLLAGLAAGVAVRAQQAGSVGTYAEREYRLVDNRWNYYSPETKQLFPVVDVITIRFREGTPGAEIEKFERENNLKQIRKNELGFCDYQLPENTDVVRAANTLSLNRWIESLDINTYGTYDAVPNDPMKTSQWYLSTISAQNAWDISTGSSSVVVAILDSGTDWAHQDLGKGADSYENIYTNSGEDAWSNPLNPATGNGVDNDGNGLVDDWKGWNFDLNNNNSTGSYFHGTHVAGLVAAKTNNNVGMAGIAGGWGGAGTRMLICNVGNTAPNGAVIDDAILYAIQRGAKIIQLSLSVGQTAAIDAALASAKTNGVVVICASGNTNPNGAGVKYPAKVESVIAVGGTNSSDTRANFADYGVELDVAAPAVNIWSTQIGNTYNYSDGTSFAAPIVSGVAALMVAKNSCVRGGYIDDILKSTADKVGGYNYNWEPIGKPGHSKELGYGRVNAERAVKAAQNVYKASIDLFTKDNINDIGLTGTGGTGGGGDKSPDIWVRNQNDGLTNQKHQNPEFASGSAVFVYVRVRNKSCVASPATAKLDLHWSKASSWSSWPDNWIGTYPTIGNYIGSQSIPVIQPGESVILTFPWTMIDPHVNNTWNSCLLSRIVNIATDPITIYPGRLDQDITENNNVSIRNVTIVDDYTSTGRMGGPVLVGNVSHEPRRFDIRLAVPDINLQSDIPVITADAEVRLIFEPEGWAIIQESGQLNQEGISIVEDRQVRITSPEVVLRNVHFPPDLRIPIDVQFRFPQEIPADRVYEYVVSQSFSEMPDQTLGYNTYYIGRREQATTTPAPTVDADAGNDQNIGVYLGTTLSAADVGLDATYKWYDMRGTLLHTGREFDVSPREDQTYRLEVVAANGARDYDEVTVHVKKYYLLSLTPNPAISEVTVGYEATAAKSAYISIVDRSGKVLENVNIKSADRQKTINTSTLVPGAYTVLLVCDGQRVDAKTLIIR